MKIDTLQPEFSDTTLANTWKVDRTRYTMGLQECLMKRYYQFHSGNGYGVVPVGDSEDLRIGAAVHKGIETFLNVGMNWDKLYYEMLNSFGQGHADPTNEQFIESSWLAGALVAVWIRKIAPEIGKHYDILGFEKPVSRLMTPEILQMFRPDLILRNKNTGKLECHDFKTTQSNSDFFTKPFANSLQMHLGCLMVEYYFGEPCETFWIHCLFKGQKRKFKNTDLEPKYATSLCYASFSPPNFPITKFTTYSTKGKWDDKTPAWKQFSRPHQWVNDLSDDILYETSALLGPFKRNDSLVNDYLSEMPRHEEWWIEQLTKLYGVQKAAGIGAQGVANILIPKSFNCTHFGKQCPYFGPCLNGETIEGNKNFKPRTPHHAEEQREMELRLGKNT